MKKLFVSIFAASCLCWCSVRPAAAQCGPGAGNCFDPAGNGSPGCEDETCCNNVCAADPFCCESTWDQVCAGEAEAICNGVPTVACCNTGVLGNGTCIDIPEANCLAAFGEPQAPGTTCAVDGCPVDGCPGAGSCFDPEGNGSPGCEDADCCEIVCLDDPFCCESQWDDLCAEAALELCVGGEISACCFLDGTCSDLGEADCAIAGGTPQPGVFCVEANCIAEEPEACCFGESGSCQDLLPTICTGMDGTPQGFGTVCEGFFCPTPCGLGAGSCFDPEGNGTPGCDDSDCCATVCLDDPYCCETEWDDICAESALVLCGGGQISACCFIDGACSDLSEADCVTAGGTSQPGASCVEANCTAEMPEACCLGETGVCQDLLPTLCTQMDGTPQGFGTVCEGFFCPTPCGPGSGDCFDPAGNGSPGCENSDCCTVVCLDDPFCCETEWDDLCAASALVLCTGAPCPRCPGDANLDDARDGLDVQAMTICLLDAANGPGLPTTAGCSCADADGDSDVDLDDVAPFVTALLDISGPCPVCGPGNGACFDLNGNGSPGCEDAACCSAVCAFDSLCCDGEWDGICAAEANVICNGAASEACCGDGVCFDLAPADCITLGGTPQGAGTTCADTVCAPAACGPGAGSCFAEHGTPGCDDPACCASVCAIDPGCCAFGWDGICVGEAETICNGLPSEACCTPFGCFDMPAANCSGLGFTPLGAGTSCATNICP